MLQLANDFRREFSQAYDDIGKRAALLYNNLLFYEYIAYTVKETMVIRLEFVFESETLLT